MRILYDLYRSPRDNSTRARDSERVVASGECDSATQEASRPVAARHKRCFVNAILRSCKFSLRFLARRRVTERGKERMVHLHRNAKVANKKATMRTQALHLGEYVFKSEFLSRKHLGISSGAFLFLECFPTRQ